MANRLLSRYLLLHAVCGASAFPSWNHTDSNNNTNSRAKPVLAHNFPDPTLVESGGSWYAFSTSSNGKNVQVALTGNFHNHDWRLLEDDVLPEPGAWAVNDRNIWAPDIIQLENARWVMYFAAPSKDSNGSHCIGAGTSTNILGPYEPIDEVLACPLSQGGAIDPAGFRDPKSGNLYVVYKVDGNNLNTGGGPCKGGGHSSAYHSTPIMVQQVDAGNGVDAVGDPFEILDRGERDGPLVEAPSLFYQPDFDLYYLTYSSNCYSTDGYDVSYAYSTDLRSNFTRSLAPIMNTASGRVTAPGGADMTADGKFAVFHGTVGTDDRGEPIRHMFAAESEQIGTDMSVWII